MILIRRDLEGCYRGMNCPLLHVQIFLTGSSPITANYSVSVQNIYWQKWNKVPFSGGMSMALTLSTVKEFALYCAGIAEEVSM